MYLILSLHYMAFPIVIGCSYHLAWGTLSAIFDTNWEMCVDIGFHVTSFPTVIEFRNDWGPKALRVIFDT